MRGLFSNFARGWAGVGLLLIRIVAGLSLMIDGMERIQTGGPIGPIIVGILAVGVGILLIAGLWTPLAGALVIAVVLWEILALHEHLYPAVLLAAIGATLALVGPGALSVDARLFGWKRIDLEH